MVARLEITVDVKAAQTMLARVPGVVERESAAALRDIGIFHTRRMQQGRFVPFSYGSRPEKMMSRTGNLRRSFRSRVDGERLSDLQLSIYTDVPYAGTQETGGTIRPKRASYLRVPLRAALTPSGAPSGRALIRPAPGGYVTDLGKTFIFKSRKGELFIGIKGQTEGGRPKAFYKLVRSVTISPRLEFVRTFQDRTTRFVRVRLAEAGRRIEGKPGGAAA